MRDFLHTLIQFNTWANHKVVASLKSCSEISPKSVELFSHILMNNWYVLDLIEGNDDGKRWYDAADYTFEQCIEEIPKLDRAYMELVNRLGDEGLQKSVTFTDFSGKVVTRRIWDLVFHTLDHCTYHRGQIATLVRQTGGEPAQVWFNRWIRDTERGTKT